MIFFLYISLSIFSASLLVCPPDHGLPLLLHQRAVPPLPQLKENIIFHFIKIPEISETGRICQIIYVGKFYFVYLAWDCMILRFIKEVILNEKYLVWNVIFFIEYNVHFEVLYSHLFIMTMSLFTQPPNTFLNMMLQDLSGLMKY